MEASLLTLWGIFYMHIDETFAGGIFLHLGLRGIIENLV